MKNINENNYNIDSIPDNLLKTINGGVSTAKNTAEEVSFKYAIGDKVYYKLGLIKFAGVIKDRAVIKFTHGMKHNEINYYCPCYYVKYDAFFVHNDWEHEDELTRA